MTPDVLLGLTLASLLNASIALWILLARPRLRRLPRPLPPSDPPSSERPALAHPLSMGHIAWAACAVGAASLVEVAVLMATVRLGPFGMIHHAWLTVAGVLPVCGLAVLLARVRGRPVRSAALVVASLSLLMIPIAIKAHWIDPTDLRVERTRVVLAPGRAGTSPLVLGVLADLQTPDVGAHEEAAVAALMEGQPDIILVPGDIFQGSEGTFDEVLPDFQRLLSRLSAPGGVWVVPGNTDYRDGLPRIVEGTGARLLRDESVRITVRDRVVTIFGVDEPTSRGWQERSVPGLAAFESAAGEEDIRILLAHRPRLVNALRPDTRVDLVVAGHTHGGQVALPFLGPPLVLSPLPRSIAAGGLHELDGRTLYISRGVGMERHQAPRIRFLVPPEVSLLTLESQASSGP